jgi:hypothetical protein
MPANSKLTTLSTSPHADQLKELRGRALETGAQINRVGRVSWDRTSKTWAIRPIYPNRQTNWVVMHRRETPTDEWEQRLWCEACDQDEGGEVCEHKAAVHTYCSLSGAAEFYFRS